MRIKLSGALFLAATTILAQNANSGLTADQLRDLASHAKDSGDLQSETNYLCQAAGLDAKKYGKKCDRAKDYASKALAQFQADLAMGRTELQRKDYPGALRDLGKITFGPDKAEAQELIRQARIGISGGVAIDPASLDAFKAAREAYFRGDFDAAESQAKRIQSPALQTAANQLLTNINIYRDNMRQADVMFHHDDLKGAEQKYQFAAVIRENGPGHPVERLHEVQAAEAEATTAKAQPAPAATIQATAPSKASPLPKANYATKVKPLLDTGHRDETQGDLKGALQAYNTALDLDGRQAEAVSGKKRVLEEIQEDTKVTDGSLTEGIAEFYASHFLHADEEISKYLQDGGKHYAGAAHFYLGASLFMQALLTSPANPLQADVLGHRGRDQFLLAKQLHYKPIESAVSPKVFAHWTQIGDQE